jgi:hypothetical protein
LAKILAIQSKLGVETRDLYQRSLAIVIRNEPDGVNHAAGECNFGHYYHLLAGIQPTVALKRKQLLLAKKHFEVGLEICLKMYDPTHPDIVDGASLLGSIMRELSQI